MGGKGFSLTVAQRASLTSALARHASVNGVRDFLLLLLAAQNVRVRIPPSRSRSMNNVRFASTSGEMGKLHGTIASHSRRGFGEKKKKEPASSETGTLHLRGSLAAAVRAAMSVGPLWVSPSRRQCVDSLCRSGIINARRSSRKGDKTLLRHQRQFDKSALKEGETDSPRSMQTNFSLFDIRRKVPTARDGLT